MKVTTREHNGYTEYHHLPEGSIPYPCMFGQWHYIYESDKGQISLVELYNHIFSDPEDRTTPMWEIMAIKGDNLFDDVERYKTREQAEVRIKELLE